MCRITSVPGKTLLTIRKGTLAFPFVESFELPDYIGPSVSFEGEYINCDESGNWKFDVYGLINYSGNMNFSWYTGMSILHLWLSEQHVRGHLTNFGIKKWVRATENSLSQLWNRNVEGVVLMYPCAPPSQLFDDLEVGNAKYLKKVVTYDLKIKMSSLGPDPPILGLPHDHAVKDVVEASLDSESGVYIFTRYRPDKHDGNPPHVLKAKKLSSSYEEVSRWITGPSDVLPFTVKVDEDPEWERFLLSGDSAVDDAFRIRLASTGYRQIIIVRGDQVTSSDWVYSVRAAYLRKALAGAYDGDLL